MNKIIYAIKIADLVVSGLKIMGLILKNITDKKIKSKYQVNNWQDILRIVAQEIYQDKKDFTPALHIRGRKRVYFSKDPKILDVAVKIEGTPYFFEGKIGANHTVYLTKKLLKAFGYSQQDFEIVY